MGFISWIILGLIAGAIAKLLLPGKDPGGFIITIIIGIIGAVIGGYISTILGFGTVTGVNFGSIIIAILGAIVLLLIYRMVKKPS
ncbi:MAG: GlsB/YeaQ/YmgE family stress response membrane protein [Deltaproteobacteria bacterium]|nr:GlsB/YeaQ/YmgE family stress response membrane protein [Deltaproteobacteria bacterium]